MAKKTTSKSASSPEKKPPTKKVKNPNTIFFSVQCQNFQNKSIRLIDNKGEFYLSKTKKIEKREGFLEDKIKQAATKENKSQTGTKTLLSANNIDKLDIVHLEVSIPKDVQIKNLELRGEYGVLLRRLPLDRKMLNEQQPVNVEIPQARVSKMLIGADRKKRMYNQAQRMTELLVYEEKNQNPRFYKFNLSCDEFKDNFEKDFEELKNVEENHSGPTQEGSKIVEHDFLKRIIEETETQIDTPNQENSKKTEVESFIDRAVGEYLAANDEESRKEELQRIKTGTTLSYILKAIKNPEDRKRQTIEDLNIALGETFIPKAPSDVPSVQDHIAIRMALPAMLSSPYQAGLVDALTEYFQQQWEFFQNERAWVIPDELPAGAQIEAMLEMTKKILTPSEVVTALIEDLNINISEEEWSTFSAIKKSEIKNHVVKFEKFHNVIPTNIADVIETSFTSSDGETSKIFSPTTLNPEERPFIRIDGIMYFASYDSLEERLESQIDPSSPIAEKITDASVYGLDIFLPVSSLPVSNKQQILKLPYLLPDEIYFTRVSTIKSIIKERINALIQEAREAETSISSSDIPIAQSSIEALSLFLHVNDGLSSTGEIVPRFPFKTFTPRSVNFGIKLNYKQLWIPLTYQAGDLVSTIPLLPGEVRKYSTKIIVKKTRKEKELEASIRIIGDETSDTGKVESEIAKKAQRSQQFSNHSDAKGSLGAFSFGSSTTAEAAAQRDVASAKKYLRESTTKASQEFKSERKLEIETFESDTSEETTSGEIKNPNNELVMTALFYELQRRFFVTEVLGGIEPVIFVAAKVPPVSKITESFIIQHDWILRQRLLDDSFDSTFDLLKDTQLSRRIELGVRKNTVDRLLGTLEETKEQLSINTGLRDKAITRVKEAIDHASASVAEGGTRDQLAAVFTGGLSSLFGSGASDGFDEALKMQEEAAQETLQRLDREINRLRSLMEMNISALDQAMQNYSEVLRETLRNEQQILRLRVHIAKNILYYMQAIWEYQIKDQQYFELYDICAPILSKNAEGKRAILRGWALLHEIADLDNLLGFKGNYLMFPLKEHNGLTELMAKPYEKQVCPKELLIPLLAGGKETSKIEKWVKEGTGEISQELINAGQIVVIPSGLTHIEALVGKHPLLEDFKLSHRAVDIRNALAEAQNKESEHLRRLLRLLGDDFSDPEVVKNTLNITNE